MFGLFGYPLMTNMNDRRWNGTANYLIIGGGGGAGGSGMVVIRYAI